MAMRLASITRWLLLGFGFVFLEGKAATPSAEESGIPRPEAGGNAGQNINPDTFLGACPDYAQYASHKQYSDIYSPESAHH
jgi:hypothetical protein